jgi:hypothetical protein
MCKKLENKTFGETLARYLYKTKEKVLPIVLNSEQYIFFKREYTRLVRNKV